MLGERTLTHQNVDCLYCGQSLSVLQKAGGSRFCANACQVRYAALPAQEVCQVCRRRLSPAQFGERLCGRADCRHEREDQLAEVERLRIETLRQAGERLRDSTAESLAISRPDYYPAVVIPASSRQFSDLADSRVKAFIRHLGKLVEDVRSSEEPFAPQRVEPEAKMHAADAESPHTSSTSLNTVLGHACGLCRGWCCQGGGNHAYLTVRTIQRVLAENPKMSLDRILVQYLTRIEAESVEESCIFHQASGCGLPRSLRSDTCNRFYCEALVELRARPSDLHSPQAFFVASSESHVLAAAFVDESGARPVTETRETEDATQPGASLD